MEKYGESGSIVSDGSICVKKGVEINGLFKHGSYSAALKNQTCKNTVKNVK